jgi:hypothetical protein
LIVSERERRGPVVLLAAGFPESDVIIGIAASTAELRHFGRGFKWIRPCCPCGSEKVWGHGFVTRIIDENVVELKRFRCPNCKRVFTLRPESHWLRFQTGFAAIAHALLNRLLQKKWPRFLPRQRCGHWLRRFQRFAEAHFPNADHVHLLLTLRDRKICFLH